MWNLFCVAVFHTSMVNWRGSICPKYMCILLYVKLYLVKWYSIDLWSIGGGGLGICAFCYMWNIFWCSGIPYIYGQLEGVHLPFSICAFCYMLNIFGVVVFHRSMVNWSEGFGPSALSICTFCYMCNSFSVVVLHRSMVNLKRGALVHVNSVICKSFFCV